MKTFLLWCGLVAGLMMNTVSAAAAGAFPGNGPESPIRDAEYDRALIGALQRSAEGGRVFTPDDLRAAVQRPLPAVGPLPEPRTAPLAEGDLFAHAGRATLAFYSATAKNARLGESAILGTACVIHPAGIAVTCLHAMRFDEPFALLAGTADGRAVGVTRILSVAPQHDLAFVQLEGEGFAALPLRGDAPAGTRVFALGMPLGVHFYLIDGLLSRYEAVANEVHGRGVVPRMNLTLDSGSGFSGGPVLDDRGNALGMVDSMRNVVREQETYTVHSAIPAAAIRAAFAGEGREPLTDEERRRAVSPHPHQVNQTTKTLTVRSPEGAVLATSDGKRIVIKVADPGGHVVAEGEAGDRFRASLPDWAQPLYDTVLIQVRDAAEGHREIKTVETKSDRGSATVVADGQTIAVKIADAAGRIVAAGEAGDRLRASLPDWAQPLYDTAIRRVGQP